MSRSMSSGKFKSTPLLVKPRRELEHCYLGQVKDKVRRHPHYKSRTETEISELAEEFITPLKLNVYFSHLVDGVGATAVTSFTSDAESSFEHSVEAARARERGIRVFRKVLTFPVKLILTQIEFNHPSLASAIAKLLHLQYGPLHAALVIDDIVLEWNTTSLVVPTHIDLVPAVLRCDVRQQSQFGQFVENYSPRVSEAITNLDFTRQIEQTYDITAKKQEAINKVIEVVVNYNQKFYYHVLKRNCQHFVADAMKALGIDKPPMFGGVLGKYLDELKVGKTQHKHATHEALDTYVQKLVSSRQIDKLSQHDLEYLLCQYFQLHITSRVESNDPNDWICHHGDMCRMREIESRIDERAMLIHKFCI